jgi:Flp pilus assembly CpaE family ATPase
MDTCKNVKYVTAREKLLFNKLHKNMPETEDVSCKNIVGLLKILKFIKCA